MAEGGRPSERGHCLLALPRALALFVVRVVLRPDRWFAAAEACPPEDAEAPNDGTPVQRASEWTGNTNSGVTGVETPIAFGVLGEVGSKRAILRYRATDPYAIEIYFITDAASWHFARELLHGAVIDRMVAGIADVQVYELNACTIAIGLSSPDGEMTLTADVVELANFLRATYAVVGRGKERVDVDGALAEMLREAL